MAEFEKLRPPKEGEPIQVRDDFSLDVPAEPIIPFIRGDGIGSDIWAATVRVLDAAVEKAYGGKRRIVWFEIFAGEAALEKYGKDVWLPDDTLRAIERYVVAIKGPLTTPVGGGIRSLNVALRQRLDLYCCLRPVRYFPGVPSPVKHPERLNIVIFRENTEDVYAGIEWRSGSPDADRVIEFLNEEMKAKIRAKSGVGVKPISAFGTKRLARMAIRYAKKRERRSVTLVHKGNIMKFTEGAFRDWGYELAREEFPDLVIPEDVLWSEHNGELPKGKILIKDRIADSMFQQLLLRPDEYECVVTPNLNGDYLSDAAAAQVGGLGLAPGGNIGDRAALFEATHGTAPKYAGQDKVNPGSLILSGVMMLEHLGWFEAAEKVIQGLEKAISNKTVTYDLERQMEGAKKLRTSEFGTEIIRNM